jgi:hypothetical protein
VQNDNKEVVPFKVPHMESVKRIEWITDYCKDKVVLHLGCGDGELHKSLINCTKKVIGVDREFYDHPHFVQADIEDDEWWTRYGKPGFEPFDVVVASEILEHLLNAGLFFDKLKCFKCPIIITVPNAYCGGRFITYAKEGYEITHPEHVCWYSYQTFTNLAERCGFQVLESKKCYFHTVEVGHASEGLLFIIRGIDEDS